MLQNSSKRAKMDGEAGVRGRGAKRVLVGGGLPAEGGLLAEGGLTSQPIEWDLGRSFWSATDDLMLIRGRQQKMTYAEIAPLLQNPTRTPKALSAHFWATLKNRMCENIPMTLTAEWQDKYDVAVGGTFEVFSACAATCAYTLAYGALHHMYVSLTP